MTSAWFQDKIRTTFDKRVDVIWHNHVPPWADAAGFCHTGERYKCVVNEGIRKQLSTAISIEGDEEQWRIV